MFGTCHNNMPRNIQVLSHTTEKEDMSVYQKENIEKMMTIIQI